LEEEGERRRQEGGKAKGRGGEGGGGDRKRVNEGVMLMGYSTRTDIHSTNGKKKKRAKG